MTSGDSLSQTARQKTDRDHAACIMLTIERLKQLIPGRRISDEEAEEILREFRGLAEIVYATWSGEQKTTAGPSGEDRLAQ